METALKWIMRNQWGSEMLEWLMLLAQYREGDQPAAALAGVYWDRREALRLKRITIQELQALYLQMLQARIEPEVWPELEREAQAYAAALPEDYDADGADGLLMQLLVAEIRRLPPCALDLPLPESADLMQLCERILADLSTRRPSASDAGAMQTSARTLYRRFLHETGITFARWKQQARLLESIRRLAAGTPVTTVAIDLGYESPGAFSTMFRRALGVAPRNFAASVPAAAVRRGSG
jgi:AraC-like DNA-binding protein